MIKIAFVSERNGKNGGKQNSLTWPLLDGDDLAEIGLEPSDTCKKGLPRVRFPRKAPPTIKSDTKD